MNGTNAKPNARQSANAWPRRHDHPPFKRVVGAARLMGPIMAWGVAPVV